MKNEKGITLVALGITIIVLSILAAVSISTGKKTIEENKVIAFINELKIVQSEVNIIVEKQKMGNTSYDSIGTKISDLDTGTLAKLTSGCFKGKTAEEMAEFKYYKVSDLKRMGIDNVEQEVVINLKTREVLSVNGIQDSGKMCYKLGDFPSESYNVAEILTIENTLKEGDYVWYEDAFGTKQKCVVLYGPENANYNKYGVQIITEGIVGNITLGSSDFNASRDSYNNAIKTLNEEAEKYRKKNDGIAKIARCVGSVPDNINYESGYFNDEFGYTSKYGTFKGKDRNYETDVKQIQNLRIENTSNSYYLASRNINLDNMQCSLQIYCIRDVGNLDVIKCIVLYPLEEDGIESQPPTIGYYTMGLRPVIRLKQGVKIESGNGTPDNPYTLAP